MTTQTEAYAQLPRTHIDLVDGTLKIVEDWFQWGYAIGLLMVGLLAFGPCTMYALAYPKLPADEQIPLAVCSVPVILLIAGGYYCMAGLLNTSQTSINSRLKRQVGPVPWTGSFEIATRDVLQVYVKRVERKKKRSSVVDWDGDSSGAQQHGAISLRNYKTATTYRVNLRTRSGDVFALSNEFSEEQSAQTFQALVQTYINQMA